MTGSGKPSGIDMTGLNVLVIGAAQGIGAAVARICARNGASLFLADRHDPADTARAIEGEHNAAISTFTCDIVDRKAVEGLARALDQAGTPPDSLALLAGINRYGDWIDQEFDGFEGDSDRVLGVNLRGPIHVARAFLPGMAARGWGRFVLTGSIAGYMGGLVSSPHYAASKGGVHALTRWLALRYAGSGVAVNAVAPGPVRTAMTEGQAIDTTKMPLGRILEPEEIAWPVGFLCSPAAAGMAGAIVDVNGGVHFS